MSSTSSHVYIDLPQGPRNFAPATMPPMSREITSRKHQGLAQGLKYKNKRIWHWWFFSRWFRSLFNFVPSMTFQCFATCTLTTRFHLHSHGSSLGTCDCDLSLIILIDYHVPQQGTSLSFKACGTSPSMIRRASPSTIAVFPTPGSPMMTSSNRGDPGSL